MKAELALDTTGMCLVCNKQMRGRIDKKFCSDGCRSQHHARRSFRVTKRMRSVNYLLRKNRTILYWLVQNSKRPVRVKRQTLLSEGFDFSLITAADISGSQVTYHCYDYQYTPVDESIVKIAHKPD